MSTEVPPGPLTTALRGADVCVVVPQTTPLQLRKFTVARYPLTERRPLALHHATYAEPRDDLFDMHYELEFGIVIRGTAIRQYMNHQATLEAGQVWFHPSLEPHGMVVVGTPCELLVFILHPQLLETASRQGHDWMRPFLLPPEKRPRWGGSGRELTDIARKLARLARTGGANLDVWAQVLLFEALLIVHEEMGSGPVAAGGTPYLPSPIQPALSLVYESRAHVGVEAAARACSMSPPVFAARFVQMMGTPFARFARLHRLKGAAAQLASTDDPLKSVALEWGFRDVSHLTKCFLAVYRTSPGAWRKSARTNRHV